MATKKLPPFLGKEPKSEEDKEMKIKRISPKLYAEAEKREGVHGKSGRKEAPAKKMAKGGAVKKLACGGATKKGKRG